MAAGLALGSARWALLRDELSSQHELGQTLVSQPAPWPVAVASLEPMRMLICSPALRLLASWPIAKEPSSGHLWELQPFWPPLPAVGFMLCISSLPTGDLPDEAHVQTHGGGAPGEPSLAPEDRVPRHPGANFPHLSRPRRCPAHWQTQTRPGSTRPDSLQGPPGTAKLSMTFLTFQKAWAQQPCQAQLQGWPGQLQDTGLFGGIQRRSQSTLNLSLLGFLFPSTLHLLHCCCVFFF